MYMLSLFGLKLLLAVIYNMGFWYIPLEKLSKCLVKILEYLEMNYYGILLDAYTSSHISMCTYIYQKNEFEIILFSILTTKQCFILVPITVYTVLYLSTIYLFCGWERNSDPFVVFSHK